MTDYAQKLQEDLRKRLDRLCLMQNEPAFHVAEHFVELRRQVDLDAERLLSKMQSVKRETGKAPKDSDVNGTRLEFIRILEELEKRTEVQPKPQIPSSETISSLEKRVDAFKDSTDSLDDLDESCAQLTREITDETDRVERLLLGEQTIIYWPREDRNQLGSLVYFGDLFLNQLEIDCLMRSKEYNEDYSFEDEPWDFLLNLPYDLSKSKQVVERLAEDDLINFDQASKFFYIGKSEDEYSGYSAEGSNVEREFVSYQYSVNKHDFSTFGTVGLDTSANLFDIYSSTSCRLEIGNPRLECLHVNLLPSPVTRLTELILLGVHFESFDTHLLASCTNLAELRLQVTFSKEVRFDLEFLRPLRRLISLELSLSNFPSDLSMIAGLTELTDLKLEGSSFFYAEKLPRMSKAALEQILSPPCLETLELSCFDIEAIDRDMLSKCSRLRKLTLAKNSIDCTIEDGSLNLGFPLCFGDSKMRAERAYCFICIKLVHSEIQYLSPASFTGMSCLKELSLKGNSITDLPPGVFQDLLSLEQLDLDKNLIRHISSGVFGELDRLWKLKLDGNPIESIEANAFAQLNHLVELSLDGCRLNSIDSDMFNGLFNLNELKLCNNSIERIEVVNEDGRRINVAKADLSDEEKQMVKKHLFNGSSRLNRLNLSGNKLEKLDMNCFSNLNSLEYLDMSSNKINELSGEAGPDLLPKLGELFLIDNQLTTIGQRALPKTLADLDLSKNKLKWLNDDVFAGCTLLRRINLAKNELTWTITEATFASCRSTFQEIDLSQNESIRFTAGAVKAIPNLLRCIEYDLSENFVNLPYCRTLRIRKLTPEVLQALKTKNFLRLEVFSLSNCSIKSLIRKPDKENKPETSDETDHFNLSWLFCLQYLEKLDLSKNLIETLDDPNLFDKSDRITQINLSDNRLSRIHRDIFDCVPLLETIDLSGNQISSIDMGLFRYLNSLKHLNLSSNGIAFLNLARLFRICPELRSLNIADNQLDDRSTAEQIDPRTSCCLWTLKSANNRLEKMEFVRDMITLRHLDLHGNRIESLMSNGENMLGRLNYLTHLSLSGNRIGSLRDEMFSHLRFKLDFLDLSGNPIKLDSVLLELI